MQKAFVVIAGFIGVALAGCSLVRPASISTPKVDLIGGTWVAQDIDGAGVVNDAISSLVFSNDARVTGRGACNRYNGTVEVRGASLIVGELLATKMACAPALMDQETKFLAALQATRTYRMEGDQLVLVDATGTARLRFSR